MPEAIEIADRQISAVFRSHCRIEAGQEAQPVGQARGRISIGQRERTSHGRFRAFVYAIDGGEQWLEQTIVRTVGKARLVLRIALADAALKLGDRLQREACEPVDEGRADQEGKRQHDGVGGDDNQPDIDEGARDEGVDGIAQRPALNSDRAGGIEALADIDDACRISGKRFHGVFGRHGCLNAVLGDQLPIGVVDGGLAAGHADREGLDQPLNLVPMAGGGVEAGNVSQKIGAGGYGDVALVADFALRHEGGHHPLGQRGEKGRRDSDHRDPAGKTETFLAPCGPRLGRLRGLSCGHCWRHPCANPVANPAARA